MTVALPIYIEEVTREGAAHHQFTVRPLHFTDPQRKGEQLPRLLARLQGDLQNKLAELSEATRHDELAHWCAAPVCEGQTLTLRLDWGRGSCQRRFFLAGYEALGRQLWFTPRLPEYHFELLPGQRLADRAAECLSQRFREIDKEQGEVDPDDFAMPDNSKAALTVLEVKFKVSFRGLPPAKDEFSAIFGGSSAKPNGERELRRAGHLLNSLYPDDLPRATGRELETADLTKWLALPDRRAIVLVGSRQVGKSAIIHEWLWRVMDGKSGARKRKVWAVSPMRLISGMSYVGQWEQRVEAVCDHLRDSDGVLYLDDLPGLFTAGQCAGSTLNVAQLLRPRLEDRAFRLLGETTPEEWRALRERDRGFADLFQVVPVGEPDDADTLRMLIEVARECELARHCAFSLEVLPTVADLHRRFAGDASPFGAAAGFLQRLAVKHGGGACGRDGVLREFHERSGLRLPVIDPRQVMDRETIVRDLRREVAGQDHVLNAFADILLRLKARLNDRGRPLGALLLLGPTGVGKTQCAKALARHLFGADDRLLRFDMNEMAGASSVRRLTGTPDQPEGLLTAAVRRQPFSVVLFDEIEKAAPEAFDLLLGVLDEGRLSDSLGRVADFTGCVILLTSNLGAREAAAPLGFGGDAGRDTSEVYVSAAERFFRPEFFNRLDGVLPFRPLSRDDLAAITARLLDEVLARDGLRQRRVFFECAPEATARLVELGFHPQLGARALKRVIEREVAQPLAAQLATRAPGHPLMLRMTHDDAGFHLAARELRPAPRTVWWPEKLATGAVVPAMVVDAAYAALDRLAADIEDRAPDGAVELTALTPAQALYYHCREQVKRVERLLDAAEARLRARPRATGRALAVTRPKPVKILVRQRISGSPVFDRAREAEALESALAETDAPDADIEETPLFAVVRELALLEVMAAERADGAALGLEVRGWRDPKAGRTQVRALLRSHWGAATRTVAADETGRGGVWAAGPNLRALLEPFLGVWLAHDRHGGHAVMRLLPHPCASPDGFRAALAAPARDADGDLTVAVTLRPDGSLLCHASGLVLAPQAAADAVRAFHLAALPPPPELAAVF